MRSLKTLVTSFFLLAGMAGLHAEALKVPMAPPGAAGGAIVPPPISFKQGKEFAAHPSDFQKLLDRLPRAAAAQPAVRPDAQPALRPATPNTWQATYYTAPASGIGNPLLLMDGSLIFHSACTSNWYKLMPNINGDYRLGSWSQIASMPGGYAPLYFASQVLSDGKVIVNGGEYQGDSSGCSAVWQTGGAIYDPGHNTWTSVAPPSGWGNIGDAQSIIRFDGTYMLANCCSTQQAFYNESTGTWTSVNVSGKADVNDEEGWVFLPDGRIATADAYVFQSTCGKHTEQFAADGSGWSALPDATEQLSDCSGNVTGRGPSHEVGPMVLRADGTVVGFSGIQTGDYAGTSIFTASTNTWKSGPHVPYINGQNYNLGDAPAATSPDGNVIFAASPGYFQPPTHFFAYLPDNGINQLPDVPNSSMTTSYFYNMLTLPTGQILMTDNTNVAYIYTPPTTTQVARSIPKVLSVGATLTRNGNYPLSGAGLNGITQGNYGDDQQAATNFPLVRITNKSTGHVFYQLTYFVAKRSIVPGFRQTIRFHVTSRTETGPSSLEVVANGVHSVATDVTIN